MSNSIYLWDSLSRGVSGLSVTPRLVGSLSAYAVVGFEPGLVFNFTNPYYRKGGADTTFDGAATFSRASTATYIDADGVLQTSEVNEPRIGNHIWDDSQWVNRGLLMEGAATNYVENSSDISLWLLSGVVVTQNYAPSPDGALTADLVTKTSTDGTTPAVSATVPTGGAVWSAFVKNVSTGWVRLRSDIGGSVLDVFLQVSTGAVGSGAAAGGVIDVGNGWYRVWATRDTTGAGGTFSVSPVAGDLGSGSGSMLLWGGQVEAGAYLTSHIPTAGSAATRAADISTVDGLTGLDDGFWVVLPAFTLSGVNGLYDRVIQFDDGDSGNRNTLFYHSNTQAMFAAQFQGGGVQADRDSSYTLGDTTKIAMRFGPDKFAVAWGDGTVYEDTDCDYVTPDRMHIAASTSTSGKPASMSLAGITIYPPTITPAKMVEFLV
jgi:hypothetical protein